MLLAVVGIFSIVNAVTPVADTGLIIATAYVTVLAVVLLIEGYRSRRPRPVKFGLSFSAVAVAFGLQGAGVYTGLTAGASIGLLLVSMVAIALIASSSLVQIVRQLQSDHTSLQVRLGRTVDLLEEATDSLVERDDDLRNGLVALMGAVHVLANGDLSGNSTEEHRYKDLLLSELQRLRGMIDGDGSDRFRLDSEESVVDNLGENPVRKSFEETSRPGVSSSMNTAIVREVLRSLPSDAARDRVLIELAWLNIVSDSNDVRHLGQSIDHFDDCLDWVLNQLGPPPTPAGDGSAFSVDPLTPQGARL